MLSRTANLIYKSSPRLLKTSFPSILSARGYHDDIVEHYENPRNVGSLDKNDVNVGTVSEKISSDAFHGF